MAEPSKNINALASMITVFIVGCLLLVGLSGCGNASSDDTSSTQTAPTAQTLSDKFNAVELGSSKSEIMNLVGRQPDLVYKGDNGDTILQWKDADVNVLRVGIHHDKNFETDSVSGASYWPAVGGVGATQVKGTL